MSRGNRRYIVATIGCLTLANSGQAEPKNTAARDYHTPANRPAVTTTTKAQIRAQPYKASCNQPRDSGEAGLCASIGQATAAKAANEIASSALYVNLAGAILLLFTLIATAWAARSAARAAKIAEEATRDADQALAVAEQNAEATANLARNILAASRPRVFANTLQPSKSNNLCLKVVCINAGQTTAIVENITVQIFRGEHRQNVSGGKHFGYNPLLSGEERTLMRPTADLLFSPKWDDAVTVRGTVTYTDIHGARYESGFSFVVYDERGVMAINPDNTRNRWYDRRIED